MIQANLGIKVRLITSRNSQANFILERIHQAIGNIICTFKVQCMVLDDEKPRDGILTSTMFALRVTVHSTTQHTPAKLVFTRVSILNTYHKKIAMNQ